MAPLSPAEALIVGFNVNELLVPVCVPSVAVIVTSKPAEGTVTVVTPTPSTKAAMTSGLIDPAEHVKDGVPV